MGQRTTKGYEVAHKPWITVGSELLTNRQYFLTPVVSQGFRYRLAGFKQYINLRSHPFSFLNSGARWSIGMTVSFTEPMPGNIEQIKANNAAKAVAYHHNALVSVTVMEMIEEFQACCTDPVPRFHVLGRWHQIDGCIANHRKKTQLHETPQECRTQW